MQKRSVRITVLLLLLAAPLAAAAFLWNVQQRAHTRTGAEGAFAARVNRVSDTIIGIGTAQQGYVAPGQLDEPWFEQTSALLLQLEEELAAVQAIVRSAEAASALQSLKESFEALKAADARTRENLRRGQELMAADVIFSDGRNLLDAMTGMLRALQSAERTWYQAESGSALRSGWILFGLAALGWYGVLAARLFTSTRSATTVAAPQQPSVTIAAPTDHASSRGPSVDLAAAAALCSDLSRVADTGVLTTLLGRAAAVLDATGIMLWMSAGEQLFAVLGHGYPPEAFARLGPMPRDADNAAASACRTGRVTGVAGTDTAGGGLVVPLFGPEVCMGVMAIELRQGRVADLDLEAVATMIASQVAAAVSAWPAASLAHAGTESPEARSA